MLSYHICSCLHIKTEYEKWMNYTSISSIINNNNKNDQRTLYIRNWHSLWFQFSVMCVCISLAWSLWFGQFIWWNSINIYVPITFWTPFEVIKRNNNSTISSSSYTIVYIIYYIYTNTPFCLWIWLCEEKKWRACWALPMSYYYMQYEFSQFNRKTKRKQINKIMHWNEDIYTNIHIDYFVDLYFIPDIDSG